MDYEKNDFSWKSSKWAMFGDSSDPQESLNAPIRRNYDIPSLNHAPQPEPLRRQILRQSAFQCQSVGFAEIVREILGFPTSSCNVQQSKATSAADRDRHWTWSCADATFRQKNEGSYCRTHRGCMKTTQGSKHAAAMLCGDVSVMGTKRVHIVQGGTKKKVGTLKEIETNVHAK